MCTNFLFFIVYIEIYNQMTIIIKVITLYYIELIMSEQIIFI
jgi:hypothetical protein